MAQNGRSGFAEVLMVELLYRTKPLTYSNTLNHKMIPYASGPANQGWEEADDENTYIYFHTNHTSASDNKTPQTCVMPHPVSIDVERYHDSLQQTWHWPQAESVLRECTYGLLVTDFMAYPLPYKDRLHIFQNSLKALLETVPCNAIYWNSSQKLIDPIKYVEALNYEEILYGAVNIRTFNIENPSYPRPGHRELVMDTCGLAALGLPDLQCHFFTPDPPVAAETNPECLTPGSVRDFLLDMLYYLYDKGNIIKDGEVCELADQRSWQCEHQFALVPPDRLVIDLNPGPPLYAGKQALKFSP
jgi:hypothetical protein